MHGDKGEYKHAAVTDRVIAAFYKVYNELGHGFLESVYANAMCVELARQGIDVRREVGLTVWYQGEAVGEFKADLIVSGVVLVELKSARDLDPAHTAQVLNYLRATQLEVGLLFNFGQKPAIKRFAYENGRKSLGERT